MEGAISRSEVPSRPAVSNLNSLLADIHVRYIAIKKEDMQRYYRVFEEVFKRLKDNMKAADKYFERYASDIQFAGSHYDHLRINKPNEFDIDVVIDVPVNMAADVSLWSSDIFIQKYRPEYLQLRAGSQYLNIPNREGNDINKTAYQWLDNKKFILGSKFIEWFKQVGNQGLNRFPKVKGQPACEVDGVTYTIRTSASGPAFTIHVESKDFQLDFDLVPALKFPETRWLRKYRKIPTSCRRGYWLAVAKPNPDGKTPDGVRNPHDDNRSWRVSVQGQENQLLYDTYQMRQIIRLIKKFRDVQGMDKLASYYIKTLFFWELGDDVQSEKKLKQKIAFWQENDIATLFKYMLRKFYNALQSREIPYFWSKRKNYINRWDSITLNEYMNKISKLLNVLDNPSDYKSAAKHLLTDKEYAEYRQFL